MKTLLKFSKTLYACFFAVVITLCTAATVKNSPANFSGAWVLNTDKSDAGELSLSTMADHLVISQDEKSITIERSVKDLTTKETLNFDGSPANSVVQGNGPDRNKVSTMKWTDDTTLEESSEYTTGFTYTSKTILNLSVDGKTLTVNTTADVKSMNKVYRCKLIYEKQ